MRRHLVGSIPLLAVLVLAGACDSILGPSRSTRGQRARYGDYVLPVGAVDVPSELQVRDSIYVRLTSIDPAACSYGGW